MLKIGDLVAANPDYYPRLAGKVLIIIERHAHGWVVATGERTHPYAIEEADLELVKAAPAERY